MNASKPSFFVPVFFFVAAAFATSPFGAVSAQDEINRFQRAFLSSQINYSVDRLITHWVEENFVEGVYRRGESLSKKQISAREFSGEMVSKDWRLDETHDNRRIERIDFENLLMADVHLNLRFKHVINVVNFLEKKVKLKVYLEKNEQNENEWRFDLLQLIELPY